MTINWKTAVKLFFSDPAGFLHAVKHRTRLKLAVWHLRNRMRNDKCSVLWVDHGWGQFPFFDDGDAQEPLYHVYGDEWLLNDVKLLSPHVNPGYVVLDVGANIGFITIMLSGLVGSEGHVHSFEPSPVVHKKLLATVDRNKLENVSLHQVACGQDEDSLILSSPTGSSGNATLADSLAVDGERVRVVRLDDYLSPLITRLDLVKIDTEGFEDQVLAGAERLVERFHPTFYIELSQEYQVSSRAAIEWLKKRGYHFPIEPDLDSSRNGDNFIATYVKG